MENIIVTFAVIVLTLISTYTIVYLKDLSNKTKVVLNLLIWSTGAMGLIFIGKILNVESGPTDYIVYGIIFICNILIVAYISKLLITANKKHLAA